MANTKAVETNTQAVSPVSIFGGSGAAAASGAAAGASGAGARSLRTCILREQGRPPCQHGKAEKDWQNLPHTAHMR